MRLTKAMQDAGILAISNLQSTNRSWKCEVLIDKIAIDSMEANPRKHDPKHTKKIAADFLLECVRDPVLWYKPNGIMPTINSRHTLYELRERMETCTCDVYFDIDAQMAARIFHDQTVNQKKIDTWTAHASALKSNLPHAKAIQGALDLRGFTTPNTVSSERIVKDWVSYLPLQEAFQQGCLDKLVDIVYHAFTNKKGRIYQDAKAIPFLRGLNALIKDNPYKSARSLAGDLTELVDYHNQEMGKDEPDVTSATFYRSLAMSFAEDAGMNRAEAGHYFSGFDAAMPVAVAKFKRRAA